MPTRDELLLELLYADETARQASADGDHITAHAYQMKAKNLEEKVLALN